MTADVPLIMGTVLFGTLCIEVAYLLVDLLYAVVDQSDGLTHCVGPGCHTDRRRRKERDHP